MPGLEATETTLFLNVSGLPQDFVQSLLNP